MSFRLQLQLRPLLPHPSGAGPCTYFSLADVDLAYFDLVGAALADPVLAVRVSSAYRRANRMPSLVAHQIREVKFPSGMGVTNFWPSRIYRLRCTSRSSFPPRRSHTTRISRGIASFMAAWFTAPVLCAGAGSIIAESTSKCRGCGSGERVRAAPAIITTKNDS